QALPGVSHIHFYGAGGNVAPGKYNDGSEANRPVLAKRLSEGMRHAWETQKKMPIQARDVEWKVTSVTLPVSDPDAEQEQLAVLADSTLALGARISAARMITFLRRMAGGH